MASTVMDLARLKSNGYLEFDLDRENIQLYCT